MGKQKGESKCRRGQAELVYVNASNVRRRNRKQGTDFIRDFKRTVRYCRGASSLLRLTKIANTTVKESVILASRPDLAVWRRARASCAHQGTAWTAESAFRLASGVSCFSKTNDQPNRSDSLSKPVAATKAAQCLLLTSVSSSQKLRSRTRRRGPSPSTTNVLGETLRLL
eukprot:1228661-Pleurochrysis_carterae.AAC.1